MIAASIKCDVASRNSWNRLRPRQMYLSVRKPALRRLTSAHSFRPSHFPRRFSLLIRYASILAAFDLSARSVPAAGAVSGDTSERAGFRRDLLALGLCPWIPPRL